MRTLKQLWEIYLQTEVPPTRVRNGRVVKNKTRQSKESDWRAWCAYLDSIKAQRPWSLNLWTRSHALNFVSTRSRMDAPSTINRRISTLKTFGNRLRDTIGTPNPWSSITAPRIAPPKPRVLGDKEWSAILSAAYSIGQKDFFQKRNGLYVLGLRELGLRPFELLELRVAQLDYGARVIKDIEVKSNATRLEKPITKRMRRPLAAYIGERERLMLRLFANAGMDWANTPVRERNRYPLFISAYNATPGSPASFYLSTKQIQRLFKGIRARTGIDIAAYDLRHDFADRFYAASGNDIVQTAQALGHSSTQCTMRYTRKPLEEVTTTTREMSDEND